VAVHRSRRVSTSSTARRPIWLILAVTLSMMLDHCCDVHETLLTRWRAPAEQRYDDIRERDTAVIIAGFGPLGRSWGASCG